jgi:hypothetical protein
MLPITKYETEILLEVKEKLSKKSSHICIQIMTILEIPVDISLNNKFSMMYLIAPNLYANLREKCGVSLLGEYIIRSMKGAPFLGTRLNFIDEMLKNVK